MYLLYIFLVLLVLLILYTLFKNIRLYINSDEGKYCISLNKYVELVALWIKEELVLQMHLFPFKKKFYPMRPSKKEKEEVPEKSKQTKGKQKSFRPKKAHAKLVYNIIKTFKVKELKLNLDTDDYVINSYLFPIFFRLSRGSHQLNINYNGNMKLILDIRNNLYSIIKTFFIYKVSNFQSQLNN